MGSLVQLMHDENQAIMEIQYKEKIIHTGITGC